MATTKKIKHPTHGQKLLILWLEANNTNICALHKKLDVTYSQLWNWVRGHLLPGLQNAIKIEQLTQGVVPCAAWSTLIEMDQPKEGVKNCKQVAKTSMPLSQRVKPKTQPKKTQAPKADKSPRKAVSK